MAGTPVQPIFPCGGTHGSCDPTRTDDVHRAARRPEPRAPSARRRPPPRSGSPDRRPRGPAPRAGRHRMLAPVDRRVLRGSALAHHAAPSARTCTAAITELLERQRSGDDEIVARVRRLPDDVRVVADKALFDVGLLGLRAVHGHDLEEIGTRAYRMAGRVLELLADDRQLRRFFQDNRLLMLPLEEEVVFLRQCADQFRIYADILHEARGTPGARRRATRLAEIVDRVPLMAAAAEALLARSAGTEAPAEPQDDTYLAAARGEGVSEGAATKEHLISGYERMLLFSGARHRCAAGGARCDGHRSAGSGGDAVRRVQLVRRGNARPAQAPGVLPRRPHRRRQEPPRGESAPGSRGRVGARGPDADDRGPELHLSVGHQRAARCDARVHPLGRGRAADLVPREVLARPVRDPARRRGREGAPAAPDLLPVDPRSRDDDRQPGPAAELRQLHGVLHVEPGLQRRAAALGADRLRRRARRATTPWTTTCGASCAARSSPSSSTGYG